MSNTNVNSINKSYHSRVEKNTSFPVKDIKNITSVQVEEAYKQLKHIASNLNDDEVDTAKGDCASMVQKDTMVRFLTDTTNNSSSGKLICYNQDETLKKQVYCPSLSFVSNEFTLNHRKSLRFV